MKNVTKAVVIAAILGATATSAQAWWGGGGPWGGSPWSGSDTMGWGDIDANFRTTGWGRSQYYPYYAAPYGGYGAPYGGGYGAPYGAPYGYGVPMQAPAAPQAQSK